MGRYKLFTDGEANPKTALSTQYGYASLILHLAPAKSSGYEVCPHASTGCRKACLNRVGYGRYLNCQQARIKRTKLWFENREQFKKLAIRDIQAHLRHCKRVGLKPAIRLNGTSDIAWEQAWPELFTTFPSVQFYDYTKNPDRCMKSYRLPANYHLVFSRTEDNQASVKRVMRSGKTSVAVVFRTEEMPKKYNSCPVVYGDAHDLQFLHPSKVVLGLKAKGRTAKYDKTGFVV